MMGGAHEKETFKLHSVFRAQQKLHTSSKHGMWKTRRCGALVLSAAIKLKTKGSGPSSFGCGCTTRRYIKTAYWLAGQRKIVRGGYQLIFQPHVKRARLSHTHTYRKSKTERYTRTFIKHKNRRVYARRIYYVREYPSITEIFRPALWKQSREACVWKIFDVLVEEARITQKLY
jgi:hypothetical protein